MRVSAPLDARPPKGSCEAHRLLFQRHRSGAVLLRQLWRHKTVCAVPPIPGMTVMARPVRENRYFCCSISVFPDGPMPVICMITSPSFAQLKCGAFGGSE